MGTLLLVLGGAALAGLVFYYAYYHVYCPVRRTFCRTTPTMSACDVLAILFEYAKRRIAGFGADPLLAPPVLADSDSTSDSSDSTSDDDDGTPEAPLDGLRVRRICIYDASAPDDVRTIEFNSVHRVMVSILGHVLQTPLQLARQFGYVFVADNVINRSVLAIYYTCGASAVEFIATYSLDQVIYFPPYACNDPFAHHAGETSAPPNNVVSATCYYDSDGSGSGDGMDCTQLVYALAGPRQNFYADAPCYRCPDIAPFVLLVNNGRYGRFPRSIRVRGSESDSVLAAPTRLFSTGSV